MSNELVSSSSGLIPLDNMAVSKYADDAAFKEVASGNTFLPRIMLMQAGSEQVKEGKASMGHFYFIRGKDQLTDLTKEAIVLPLSWRPKAMDMSNLEAIVTIYNPKDPEFERIVEKSGETNSNCMYGPEFLIWVPAVSAFATYFMSSKTSRREAPNLRGLLGRGATLKSNLIKMKKFSWFGPQVTICSQQFPIPSRDEASAEVTKFANPPEKETQAAPEDERAR